jgi:uncharacterized membrane protein YgcG
LPPAAQAPSQQQAPPQQPPPSDAHLVALIVAALAAYWTAAALTRALRAPFRAAGISAAALSAVAALVASWPHDPLEGTGPAQRHVIRQNYLRRAQFFLSAARRVHAAVVAARSQGEPVRAAIRDALGRERQWMSRHVAACSQRVRAAAAVDGMAAVHGGILGWQATLDKRCSPGCAKASGKNFRAGRPPVIEGHPAFPGAVHPYCRCRPVPPFKGAALLP